MAVEVNFSGEEESEILRDRVLLSNGHSTYQLLKLNTDHGVDSGGDSAGSGHGHVGKTSERGSAWSPFDGAPVIPDSSPDGDSTQSVVAEQMTEAGWADFEGHVAPLSGLPSASEGVVSGQSCLAVLAEFDPLVSTETNAMADSRPVTLATSSCMASTGLDWADFGEDGTGRRSDFSDHTNPNTVHRVGAVATKGEPSNDVSCGTIVDERNWADFETVQTRVISSEDANTSPGAGSTVNEETDWDPFPSSTCESQGDFGDFSGSSFMSSTSPPVSLQHCHASMEHLDAGLDREPSPVGFTSGDTLVGEESTAELSHCLTSDQLFRDCFSVTRPTTVPDSVDLSSSPPQWRWLLSVADQKFWMGVSASACSPPLFPLRCAAAEHRLRGVLFPDKELSLGSGAIESGVGGVCNTFDWSREPERRGSISPDPLFRHKPITPVDIHFDHAQAALGLANLCDDELECMCVEMEMKFQNMSDSLVNDLQQRDTLLRNVAAMNQFITALLRVQDLRHTHCVNGGGEPGRGWSWPARGKEEKGMGLKFLCTVIPYQPPQGQWRLSTLRQLTKILQAISEGSDSVPMLMSEYLKSEVFADHPENLENSSEERDVCSTTL